MMPLFQDVFRHILAVGAQSPLDVERFKKLGFKTVENTHNLKFSLQLPEVDRKAVRSEWGIEEGDFVLVWGSSRPGEEELLREIHPLLKGSIPNLKLIIAPRHLNRLSQVKEIFKNESTTFLSEISSPYEVLIIDSLGVLFKAYALSDISVVGGSFFDFGGHNPLEPAFYSIPTIIGDFHSSCRHVVNELLKADEIIVANKASLAKEIISLYQDKIKMQKLGFKAKNVVNQNSFALVETLSLIQRFSR
jgi:3-deoxy-D-manno-octulosonic-acid transferase